jgi:hypothetical protein
MKIRQLLQPKTIIFLHVCLICVAQFVFRGSFFKENAIGADVAAACNLTKDLYHKTLQICSAQIP